MLSTLNPLFLFVFGEAIGETFASERKFAKLVSNHVLGNVYWHVVFAVVNKELETYKGRENGAASSYELNPLFSVSFKDRMTDLELP